MNNIVELTNVTRAFSGKKALDNVSLTLEKGQVLGLVGENAAGKTTIIKHILGLLKPDSGTVRVFGEDPVKEPVSVLARIGYMSEEDVMPGWMRISELQRYLRGFYPTWDQEYALKLQKDFDIPDTPFMTLSKGQRARAALMAALAYRPDLLLFDEPSSGLDPVVRRDILGAIVRTIADEGRTVLFSSHLLGEVDRVADRIAMVKNGKVVFCDRLDNLKQSHLELTLRFPTARTSPPHFEGVIAAEGSGREWSVLYQGDIEDAQAFAVGLEATIEEHRWASLDAIFVAYARPTIGAER